MIDPQLSPTHAIRVTEGWRRGPVAVRARRGEVHVWRADFRHARPAADRLAALLGPEERARADRFQREEPRARFVAARAILRVILGRYLEVEPGSLRFDYSEHGKPSLAAPGPSELRFNLSHADDIALYAVAHGREIGIDVERVRPELAAERIAESFFAPDEVAALRALPHQAQADAFFACWTRKEAFVKARGRGFSFGFDRFAVSLAPDQRAALLRVDPPEDGTCWAVESLAPHTGYVGALVVEGQDWELRCWDWGG